MKLAPVRPELKAEWRAEFKKLGYSRVSTSLEHNTFSWSTEKLHLAREWCEEQRRTISLADLRMRSEQIKIAKLTPIVAALMTVIAAIASALITWYLRTR